MVTTLSGSVRTSRRNLKTELSPNASKSIFHPHQEGEIWKRNIHRPSWIRVWGRPCQGIEITWLSWRHRLRKAPCSKPSTLKCKAGVYKNFPGFKNVLSFRDGSVLDGRPNRRNKARYSNFSGVSFLLGRAIKGTQSALGPRWPGH